MHLSISPRLLNPWDVLARNTSLAEVEGFALIASSCPMQVSSYALVNTTAVDSKATPKPKSYLSS